jgi:spermidine synthase
VRLTLGAFVAGFATLALEVTSVRLLAPSFGASLLVFTSVVGVILAGLAAGYVLGGRVADRRPEPRPLGWILLAAGVLVILLPAAARPLLAVARSAISSASVSLFLWSLGAATLLVMPPTVLLGMVTPFLIRLRAKEIAMVGRAAGNLSAVGTVGSILGTFAPVLLLIPLLGTTSTLRLLGGLAVLTSLLFLGRKGPAAALLSAAAMLFPARAARPPGVLAEVESPYQHLAVEQLPDGTRILTVNEGLAAQSTYVPGGRLSGTMYDAFLLAGAMKDGGVHTLAEIGLAGGTIAHDFQCQLPAVRVTGVELDPEVIALGRRYFTLNDPNLTVVNADGRVFLQGTQERFDAVVVDVFRQPHIPFPFTTKEFFALVRSRLEPGGVFLMNVAAFDHQDPLLGGILNTIAAVFREVWVFHPSHYLNFLVLATDAPGLRERLVVNPVPAAVEDWRVALLQGMERVPFDGVGPVYTDDRSPAEVLGDLLFLRYLAAERF